MPQRFISKQKLGTQTVKKDDLLLELFAKQMGASIERFAQQMSEKIAERILQNEDVMYELAQITFRMIDQAKIKGDKGDSPTENELKALIKPLIPPPEKGEPGYTPRKGVDYFDGEPGKNGEDFFTPEQRDLFLADLVNRVLTDPSFSGVGIVDKVNALEIKPEFQIDASHIKNLPEVTIEESKKSVKLYSGIHRGGLKLIWDTDLEGTIDGVNTVFTLPAALPSPKDGKYLVDARGVAKTARSGDFSISNNNRTVTFTIAPPSGSARPRIVLYHGK